MLLVYLSFHGLVGFHLGSLTEIAKGMSFDATDLAVYARSSLSHLHIYSLWSSERLWRSL